ncbi:hypothetical protein MmiHf6_15450 [Methanimicrococcus hongohii]|uniref:Uncharacterized protein n=1 Tax=Methanimicrococcus hongohii TaxID=3028295 RepID=A0AA96ZT77_9EURY|nr:hypothetical protein MmiHf6_15450 [Methanimicrococcus sp. Hf6]
MKKSFIKNSQNRRSRRVLPALMTLIAVSAVVAGFRSKLRQK